MSFNPITRRHTYFKIPKFKRGQVVVTPDGKGTIDHMKYVGGTWYSVKGRYYSEGELHL